MHKTLMQCFEKMKCGKNKWSGFTLLELLIVVMIVAALTAIAYPLYTKTVAKSRIVEAINLIDMVKTRQGQYYTKNGQYFSTFDPNTKLTNNPKEKIYDDNASKLYSGRGYDIILTGGTGNCVRAKYNKGGLEFEVSSNYETHALGCSSNDRLCETFGDRFGYSGQSAEEVCNCGAMELEDAKGYTLDLDTCRYTVCNKACNLGDKCVDEFVNSEACECGYRTRSVASCTGGEESSWTACPVKPSASSASYTETREGVEYCGQQDTAYVCVNNSWTPQTTASASNPMPSSSTQACQTETTCGTQSITYFCSSATYNWEQTLGACSGDSDKPVSSKLCGLDNCGTQTRTVICASSAWTAGEWSICSCTQCETNQCWNGTQCESKGAETQTCASYDESYCEGDVAVTYTCVAGTGWDKNYNTTGCTACDSGEESCTCPDGWSGTSWTITSGSCSDTYAAHCTKACNCSDVEFDAKVLTTISYGGSCNYTSCTKAVSKTCDCADDGKTGTPTYGTTQTCTYNYGSTPCTVTCDFTGCSEDHDCTTTQCWNGTTCENKGAATQTCSSYNESYCEGDVSITYTCVDGTGWTKSYNETNCTECQTEQNCYCPSGYIGDSWTITSGSCLSTYSAHCTKTVSGTCNCADDGKTGTPYAGTTQTCTYNYGATPCTVTCDYTGCTDTSSSSCSCPSGYTGTPWTIESGNCEDTYSSHCTKTLTETCACADVGKTGTPAAGTTQSCTYSYGSTPCTVCNYAGCSTTCSCPSGYTGTSWTITSGSCSDTYSSNCTKACNCSDQGFDAKVLTSVPYGSSCNYSSCTKSVTKTCSCPSGYTGTPTSTSCTYNYGSSVCTPPDCNFSVCYASNSQYCYCSTINKKGTPTYPLQSCTYYYPNTTCTVNCVYSGCQDYVWTKEGNYDASTCDKMWENHPDVGYCWFAEGDACVYGTELARCVIEPYPDDCRLNHYECL